MRVVITGAASGIGRAVTEQLVAGTLIRGEHQLLLVDRDADRLAEVSQAIGPNAHALVADVMARTWAASTASRAMPGSSTEAA
jgi:NADP-dependent 3-hydroxy acid dehydrogenase YdfG